MSRIIDLNQKFETDLPLYPGLTKSFGNPWKPYEGTSRLHRSDRMDRLSPNCSIHINIHRSTPIDALVNFGQGSLNFDQFLLDPNPSPNLLLVDRLAAKRFRFAGFPLKFNGANGDPL